MSVLLALSQTCCAIQISWCSALPSCSAMSVGPVDPTIRAGERFYCEDDPGCKGTILYVGPVASASNPNAIYVGVAFDGENRGKHDGSLAGKRYFTCPAGRGAFIHPKRVVLGIPFLQA